ncbi:MAG: fluoride efflux transporter CrcB [Candidatus Poseidoniaceae archaeon]|tara:strand:+ start:96 stop:467 length:372 start_codon:yes stop_codon:yes gene_type:complete
MLQQIALVALGGAVGAALRYVVGEWLSSDGFPFATLSVNLAGSFLLGLLTVGIAQNLVSTDMALIVATGVLGAFTTMSTYSVETIELFDQGESAMAFTYIGLTMLICPLLAFIGWKAGEVLWL